MWLTAPLMLHAQTNQDHAPSASTASPDFTELLAAYSEFWSIDPDTIQVYVDRRVVQVEMIAPHQYQITKVFPNGTTGSELWIRQNDHYVQSTHVTALPDPEDPPSGQ